MSLVVQIVSLLLLAGIGSIAALVYRAKRRSLNFLRGPPRPSLSLGLEWDYLSARVSGVLETAWFAEYGPTFKFPGAFGEDVLMVSDPLALQHIFHKSAYRYKKPMDVEHITTKLFGPGIIVVNGMLISPVPRNVIHVLNALGDAHQRQRKILNPAFSASQIKPFAGVFSIAAQSLTQKWRNEIENAGGVEVIDTVRWLPNMTLDALGESIFEYEFGALEGKNSSELCDIIRDLFSDSRRPSQYRMLRNASYRFIPQWAIRLVALNKTKEDYRFEHWLNRSQSVAQHLVSMKAESSEVMGTKNNDLMGVLARAMYATDPEKQLNHREALSQMATIIFAGHETSASSLTWLLYQLAHHPIYQEKVYQEIKNLREETGNEGDLTSKDFENLPILNAVIRETLRFNPIVPELVREAEVDDVIPLDTPVVDVNGSLIREIPVVRGQRVTSSIYHYNRFKSIWGDDAEEWNPDRFFTKQIPTTLGMFGNLMTFSGGIRGCIGWRFAILEIQIVLAKLVEEFVFTAPKDVEVEMVKLGLAVPMIKRKWHEGSQMPLVVKAREH